MCPNKATVLLEVFAKNGLRIIGYIARNNSPMPPKGGNAIQGTAPIRAILTLKSGCHTATSPQKIVAAKQ
jgi:hypothetical protein